MIYPIPGQIFERDGKRFSFVENRYHLPGCEFIFNELDEHDQFIKVIEMTEAEYAELQKAQDRSSTVFYEDSKPVLELVAIICQNGKVLVEMDGDEASLPTVVINPKSMVSVNINSKNILVSHFTARGLSIGLFPEPVVSRVRSNRVVQAYAGYVTGETNNLYSPYPGKKYLWIDEWVINHLI